MNLNETNTPEASTAEGPMAEFYTCIGKGGEYELIGQATGAGLCRGEHRPFVYRDTATGQLYYREAVNFYTRMQPIEVSRAPVTTIPKFKFETLVEHCKFQDRTIAELRAHCNDLELYRENAVWYWQHDGQDFLESLTCPVVIPASQLRELLKDKLPTDQMGKPFTYSSTQSTNCAGCGKYKHTPLRVDDMGGYVCLTCIDTRLGDLLSAESARECEKDWLGCQEVADQPDVHEALQAFSGDPTGDAGVIVVKAVIDAAGLAFESVKTKAELYDEVWQKAKDMGFMNVTMALEQLTKSNLRKCDGNHGGPNCGVPECWVDGEPVAITVVDDPLGDPLFDDFHDLRNGNRATRRAAEMGITLYKGGVRPQRKDVGHSCNASGPKTESGMVTCSICGYDWEMPF